MSTYYLGVDDTDILGRKPGTGRLARELGALLQADGLARLVGVVRQQLLIDPRIPYTSHNSPACLVLEISSTENGGVAHLFERAARWVGEQSAQGSDPGLCLAAAAAVSAAVRAFGTRASVEVIEKTEALTLARDAGLRIEELGGDGGGVIGALAGVGLTADGNSGRFLEYGAGLRDLPQDLPAGLLRQRGIALLNLARNAEPIPDAASVHIGDRLRPRLLCGGPVLLVEAGPDGWTSFDRRPPKPDGHDHEHGHGHGNGDGRNDG